MESLFSELCTLTELQPTTQVALATYNITPSNTRSYAAVKLLNAVNDSYHASAVLDCGPDDVLVELRMCLSLDLEPIACPKHLKSTCGATVTLPEGNPVSDPSNASLTVRCASESLRGAHWKASVDGGAKE